MNEGSHKSYVVIAGQFARSALFVLFEKCSILHLVNNTMNQGSHRIKWYNRAGQFARTAVIYYMEHYSKEQLILFFVYEWLNGYDELWESDVLLLRSILLFHP